MGWTTDEVLIYSLEGQKILVFHSVNTDSGAHSVS